MTVFTATITRRQPTVAGPWSIPDTEHAVSFELSDWGSTATIDLLVEMSYDAGTTWKPIASGLGVGNGPGRNGHGVGISLNPLPLQCALCPNEYLPNDPRYDAALSHCTTTLNAGVTFAQLGQLLPYPVVSTADFAQRILVDKNGNDIDGTYVTRTFHTPVPKAGPLRQIRLTATPSANLTTTLTVTSS